MIEPEALLAPIPGDVPQGIDLRNPNKHPSLYDAQAALRTARQRDEKADPAAPADWATVETLCSVILAEHSKDLEAAAGLTEALVHNDGFAGLAAGGTLIAGLAERFWSGLFPAPEEDEPDVSAETARLQPLISFVDEQGRLLPAIRRVALFTLDDGTDFAYADCMASRAWTAVRPEERAKRLGALPPAERAAREQTPGGRLWDDVKLALRADPGGRVAATRNDVAASLAAWQSVAASLQARASAGLLTCETVLDYLGDVLRTMADVAPPPLVAPVELPATNDPAAENMMVQPGTPSVVAVQPLATRDDALRQLTEITAFFRRTEPHSPVAYTLEEAIRRARLAWPEWLAEVVPDRQQRDAILSRLGLRLDIGNG